jgi:probable rRNA maturation factor
VIVNLQRKLKVDTKLFEAFAVEVKAALETPGREFSVAFVSDRRMKDLNKLFRGKDDTTDVLSFPHEPDEFESKSDGFSRSSEGTPEGVTLTFLGDIVISVEQAAKQAEENGLTLELEIKQLILHGVLHLSGYDHETDKGEMNARELELRDKLGI